MKPKLSILYQDEYLLIVDKPHGLLTTPGKGPDKQDCLIARALVDFPNARVVHRLDMATSGIVVFALSHRTQVAMNKLFEQRLVKKVYIAIVAGRLGEMSNELTGEVTLPLICDWENRPKQKVCLETGKTAHTRFTLLSYNTGDTGSHYSRIKLEPLTGRSHQLRVHMMALGHPIVGDYFYAPKEVCRKSERLLLHAHQIRFIHPLTGQVIAILSPMPF